MIPTCSHVPTGSLPRGMDRHLVKTFATVAATGALLVFGSGATFGAGAAGSVMVGVVVGLSNLWVLSRVVAMVAVPTTEAPSSARFAWSVIALGKTMVLFGGVWWLMTRHLVDPMQLVVGYGALPIGIAIGALVSDKT